MDSNLMHSACVRLAEDDASLAIIRKSFKLGPTIFTLGRDATNSNFVAHHLDGFVAHNLLTKKSIKNHKSK